MTGKRTVDWITVRDDGEFVITSPAKFKIKLNDNANKNIMDGIIRNRFKRVVAHDKRGEWHKYG